MRQAGYLIQAICEVVGVSRAGFYRWRRRQAGAGFPDRKYLGSRDPAGDAQILARIQEIKRRHPFWGYRRVRAWLKYREELMVGHKRVYCLMKETNFWCRRKGIGPSANRQVASPEPNGPVSSGVST